MHRSISSLSTMVRASVFTLALTGWSAIGHAADPGHAWRGSWLAPRASAQVVQNTTGNAYALQVGIAPSISLGHLPIGLDLLLEYGALRDTQHHVFSVPSAQLLIDWAVAPRLSLAIGAGTQFWFAPTKPLTRPVVTAEAHYVPPQPWLRVVRSLFVASSAGASSGPGLQVRAGVQFDLHRTASAVAAPQTAPEIKDAAPLLAACPPVPACPPCVVAAPIPAAQAVDQTLTPPMHFAFNVTTLDAAGGAYLARLAQALTASGSHFRVLAITGHASARGTDAQNLTVSLRRAQHVAQALVAHGVPDHKLTVHGVGESEPLPGVGPNDAAQQCVVLQLLGAELDGPLKAISTVPSPTEEPKP